MKRLLAGLLALLMVFTVLPLEIFAQTTTETEALEQTQSVPDQQETPNSEEEDRTEEALPGEEARTEEALPEEETRTEEVLPEEEETVTQENEPDEPLPQEPAVMEESGTVWAETVTGTVSNEQTAQADSNLIQLGTPTDLEWGYNHQLFVWDPETQTGSYETVEAPGYASWKTAQPDQAQARFAVYREGEAEPVYWTNWYFNSTEEPEWRSVGNFAASEPESGSYYFTVTSLGDGVTYADSETAVSGIWTYTKPDAAIEKPGVPVWDWPNVSWSAPEVTDNIGGYMVEYLYAQEENAQPYSIGWTSSYYPYPNGSIPDNYVQSCGVGYYYARVRALSSDITVICNGEWSEMSAAYNLTEVDSGVGEDLDLILNNAQNKEQVLLAVQALNTTALEAAMLADQEDTGAVAQIAALEEKAGVTAGVTVTEDANAFDESLVSVVGAGLNGSAYSEDSVTLVIDKPEKDNVIPDNYNNSVAVKFSMDLENVVDTENLEVPVKITLPVPAAINPGFLVILHYHADGTVEEIRPYVYQEGEQFYAAFVLTSFSDFAMTQLIVKGDLTEDGKVTEADVCYLLMHTFFPELYRIEVAADADVNGDDSVTDADALQLLWDLVFPET